MDEVTEVLDPLQMLPAPGQGALAVECRAADTELVAAVRDAIDDPRTRAAVTAERAVLATLEAGCSAPVGALAEIAEGDDGDELWLRAVALSGDGTRRRTAVRHRVPGRCGEGRPGSGRGDVGRRGVGPDRGADVMTSTSTTETQPTTSTKKATVSNTATTSPETQGDTTATAATKRRPPRAAGRPPHPRPS